ncbi:MAG: sensor histidine kinase, partial [Rhodopirellula sp.]|nr:sensor histidine kinase [Rhodopirellula sp.]
MDTPMRSHEELTQQVESLQRQVEDLQNQLVRAQKMSSVGEMAASITHEFNNILTTTINYAKMGLRHKDAATREKAFNRILSAGQRAARITTGMLAYARSKGVSKEEIDLSQIVSDVLILCEKDLQMNRVKLQTDILGHPICEVNI